LARLFVPGYAIVFIGLTKNRRICYQRFGQYHLTKILALYGSKESRPIADPALVCGEGAGFGLPPEGEALQDFALLNMILECWSNGVLKKRKSNTDLL
jgi:hypothetical protein